MSTTYFAYGANLASKVLLRRGIAPTEARRAVLHGYRLEFADVGIPWVEPGFATLEQHVDGTVHGVLYTLTEAEQERLDRFEGADNERIAIQVQLDDGPLHPAVTYRSRVRRAGLRPSRRCEHELDPGWIRRLEAHPTAYVPGASELVGFGFGFFDRLNQGSGFFDALFHR